MCFNTGLKQLAIVYDNQIPYQQMFATVIENWTPPNTCPKQIYGGYFPNLFYLHIKINAPY